MIAESILNLWTIMALITLQNISMAFGHKPLLDNISLQVEAGEKIALLGRNGAGKSTFMKVINQSLSPDSGDIITSKYFRSSILSQDVPFDTDGSIKEIILGGLESPDAGLSLQKDEQSNQNRVDYLLSLLSLNGNDRFETLSAGKKRRALLGRALAPEPDILLLDEPTNHLDIESIEWLESFLVKYEGTLLLVTHDRAFMQRIANRIIEIDRGRLFDWRCSYSTFLDRKSAWLENEEEQNRAFDKKLAIEEAWIRQGIKARRTRNEGRVRALKKMREEHSQRRSIQGNAKIEANSAGRSGKMVAEVEHIEFGFDEKKLINDFSVRIMRGDKIGIIGPNGCGKSTLIKLILGILEPENGSVRLGANLEIAFFDQLRDTIDDSKSLIDNVSGGVEHVMLNGKEKHIISYLQDFLFTPERAKEKAAVLSGGEKNRLLLAKNFTRPANVLVLDEPTNDLDIETVELLEELIADFDGTVLIVSHDRSFLNNCVTDIISFEKDGAIKSFAGGYDDYLIQNKTETQSSKTKKADKPKREKQQKLKMSFKENKELESLPHDLETTEKRIEELQNELGNPELYKESKEHIQALKDELSEKEEMLETLFARWEELEAKKALVEKQ